MTNSDSKTPKIRILKRSEPVPQSLMNSESGILKSKFQKNKTDVAYWKSKPKGVKPEVMHVQKLSNFHHKVQKSKGKAKIMVPRQRLLKTYDMREVYVPHPHNERWRKCEI